MRWRRRHRAAAPVHLLQVGASAGLVVAVEGGDLAAELAPFVGPHVGLAPAGAEVAIRVRRDPELRPAAIQVVELRARPSRPPAAFHRLGDAVADLWLRLEHLTASASKAPLIHAGIVEVDGLAIVVVGPSRSGKSTLVAALAGLPGVAYGTDEMARIDGKGTVTGLARPVHLRTDRQVELPAVWPVTSSADKVLVAPLDVASGAPAGLIVQPDRTDDADDAHEALTPLTTAAAARLLLANSFNVATLGWPAIDEVVALAAGASAVRARYREAVGAAARIRDALAPPRPTARAEPVEIEGRGGRLWRFDDSILVVSGDATTVLSLVVPDGAADPTTPQIRATVDRALAGSSW